MLDIILMLLSASAFGVQAILGLLVTTRPPPTENRLYFEFAFVLTSIIGACAIVLSGLRGFDAQNKLQGTVDDVRGTQHSLLQSNSFMSSTINGMANELRGLRKQLDDLVRRQVAQSSEPSPVVRKTRSTPPPATNPPTLAHISFVQRQIVSTDPAEPYATQVIIQTDIDISNPAFAVVCDGGVDSGDFFVTGQGAMMNVENGTSNNGHAFFFRFGFPTFTPESPIVVTLHSKAPLKVLRIEDIRGR